MDINNLQKFCFSLYDSGNYYGGTRNKYTYNMVANVIIAGTIFHRRLYIYYDNTIPNNIINYM